MSNSETPVTTLRIECHQPPLHGSRWLVAIAIVVAVVIAVPG